MTEIAEVVSSCKHCGARLPKKLRRISKIRQEGFCSRDCKRLHRLGSKERGNRTGVYLDYALLNNTVFCPDCKQPLQRGIGWIGHRSGVVVQSCKNEDCDVIEIRGNRVIRSALSLKKPDPKEVEYIINTVIAPQELYNSIHILDCQRTVKGSYIGSERPIITLRGGNSLLTIVQQTNLIRTLENHGFSLKGRRPMEPVITWAERRRNLMELPLLVREKAQHFQDMHTDADVMISVSTDECTPKDDIFLQFSKPVRGIELTKGERVKLASLLLTDFKSFINQVKGEEKTREKYPIEKSALKGGE